MSAEPSTPGGFEAALVARLRGQLAMAELKIQALEAELRLERIKKYGPKSDVVPSDQLELLEAEPGVSEAEVAEEAQREAVTPIERENRKRRKPHPGRQTLPEHLPRVERVIACTPEQCVCADCGKERTRHRLRRERTT